ncbi:MAG: hypothetical protein U5O16_02840 [Rhodococcus sp. (in: high G+C Gram-positive bacteria)]|uniref:hypothetical protein n=1 Tax=Rhodococcus sp. TaxID=1831 RepID=UPI002AD70931|nr:hypothetical protein [Rhodococcus sp. (in: high G+C Gram-positive bacteria)]
MTDLPRADFRSAKSRVERAIAFRNEMGALREKERAEGTFSVSRVQRGSAIILEASYKPAPELEVVFGDWLANMRAALDYLFFQLAVEDTKKNPPTRQGARQFPIKRRVEDFDAMRGSDAFHGLSERTINAVESMQPYHTKYGAEGNALLWLHDHARMDRHRAPLRMGTIIKDFRAVCHPIGNIGAVSFETIDPQVTPAVVGEGEALVLATVRCASTSDAARLVNRVEVWIDADLEVIDWYRDSHKSGKSANIRNDSLEDRMKFVEDYFGMVLDHFEKMLEN